MSAVPEGRHRSRAWKRGWWWIVLLGCAALMLVIAVVYVRRKPPALQPQRPPLSYAEKMQLLQQTWEAIGRLENESDLDKAAATFATVCEKLPEERLGWQNQAIARLLAIRNDEPGSPELRQSAQQAIEQLLERFPSAEAYWIAAQFMGRLAGVDESQRAARIVELLEEAQKRDPENAVYPMAIYETLLASPAPDNLQRAYQALGAAYRLASDNLHVLAEWLPVQAEQRDPEIIQTLRQARQTIGPLWRSILGGDNLGRDDAVSSLGRNVLEMIDEAIRAAEQQQWPQVLVLARQIKNGIGPLIVHRNDTGRVLPHPLAFVVHDFSDSFYQGLPPPTDVQIRLTYTPPEEVSPAQKTDGRRVVDLIVADFDLDRQPDWIVLFDDGVEVYRSQPNGLPGSVIASIELSGGMRGILAGDLDNDHLAARQPATNSPTGDAAADSKWHQADLDLVVYGQSGVVVLENRASPQGRQLVPLSQPDIEHVPQNVIAAVLVDFDHDADLDLVWSTPSQVGCWSGRGNGTFEDLSSFSLLPQQAEVQRLVAVDWERDADVDLLCADRFSGPALLENLLHGHLAWRALAPPSPVAVRDLVVGDFDGNGSWDLAVATGQQLVVLWTTTDLHGQVRFTSQQEVAQGAYERLLAADLDNSGFPDLVAWGPNGWQAFRGAPAKRWEHWQVLPENIHPERVRSYDIDRDGDLDLVWTENGRVFWSRNDGGNQNHWIQFRLVGQCDNKGCSGHTGIGSLIELRTGHHYQAQTVESDTTHFGLGAANQADVARIVWTNGVPQTILRPSANQYVTEVMTLKGSCPYLYAWDGERFVFVTDLLWAAPLGLQSARGRLAPSRPWEYVKIPGDLLRPRDGHYELRITEELWEAAYIDKVELLTVDHPAEIEIYSNEKVGPPEIAEFAVHTVHRRRLPRAARDHLGRDVLPWIEARDERYLAAWQTRIRQGLTELHYVELDLGDLPNPRKILLFLTGWIYPTNTSLNVSFTNHPDLDGPKYPAIWAPDAQGHWQEVVPFMGFPGGKPKTIVVDVSTIFTPGDYRLRIVSSAEIYWDEIFFTVDEEPAPVEVRRVAASEAALRFRGFSERIPYHDNKPEWYVYERVDPAPRWPVMRGYFTRYGEVTSLVADQDDRLVVMGSGDELAVKFSVPPGPRPGWKRDFLLHCVGWDKDADLNTIWGQSVEPLPYRGMTEYPYDPRSAPQSPEYLEYLRNYQTRRQNPAWFWRWIQHANASD
ncbi:MAG: hypothetical protein KatS3mg109_1282 [Pirellulaceae bacterium]|nr:MAG: hypothetical protein KatS3mg109_1282 [Pirellulaceae bacterium]